MSRLCYNLVFVTLLVIIFYIAPTSCFAEWMTKDFCDRPLGLKILYLYSVLQQLPTPYRIDYHEGLLLLYFVTENCTPFLCMHQLSLHHFCNKSCIDLIDSSAFLASAIMYAALLPRKGRSDNEQFRGRVFRADCVCLPRIRRAEIRRHLPTRRDAARSP